MFKAKAALITGSLGGIGFATAKALAALGFDIMLNGFAPRDTVDARVAEIQALGLSPRRRSQTTGGDRGDGGGGGARRRR